GHCIKRDAAAGSDSQIDVRAIAGQQLHESHHAPMPCLVAPTGTDRAPEAKLSFRVGNDDGFVVLSYVGEQYASFQAHMRVGKKARHNADAIFPDLLASDATQHRIPAFALASPGDALLEAQLVLADMEGQAAREGTGKEPFPGTMLLPRLAQEIHHDGLGVPAFDLRVRGPVLHELEKVEVSFGAKRADLLEMLCQVERTGEGQEAIAKFGHREFKGGAQLTQQCVIGPVAWNQVIQP